MVDDVLDFKSFAEVLNEIENTSSRLKKQDILSEYLKKVMKKCKDSTVAILFMCTATPFPPFVNLEMNIGEKMIQQLVCDCCGFDLKTVREKVVKSGDYATIMEEHRTTGTITKFFGTTQKDESLLKVLDVYKMMQSICKIQGNKSGENKKKEIQQVLRKASPIESKFIVRLLETKMKIGLAQQIVLISFAHALNVEPEIIKNGFNKRGDYNYLVEKCLKHKNELDYDIFYIAPTIPLKPMLASPVTNIKTALDKFEDEILAEFKYDGERIQIHSCLDKISVKNNKTENEPKKVKTNWFGAKPVEEKTKAQKDVQNQTTLNHTSSIQGTTQEIYNKIFSRNSENITEKYDDVAKVKFHEKSYILDGEVVAFFDDKIQPFQVLATRKRKLNEKDEKQGVSVCIFVFDLLYFDGQELLDLSLKERRKILHSNFKEIPGVLQYAKGEVFDKTNEEGVTELFTEACGNYCEGLMIKNLSAVYRPSHRSNKWIKLKKDYLETVGDSVDLVVVGAYYGKGKRTGWYGGYLLAAYNEDEDIFEPVCKLGTGFSEEELAKFNKDLVPIKEKEKHRISYKCKINPDIYVEPKAVWEVKAASFSLSPLYRVGEREFEEDKGISMRFPRFIREREDKTVEMATNTAQIIEMYNNQENNTEEEKDVDEEDIWN